MSSPTPRVRQASTGTRPIQRCLRGVVAVLAIVAGVLAAVGCAGRRAPANESGPVDVKSVARAIVEDLRDRDFAALAGRVDPTAGVRFSPYAYVEPDLDLRFTADEIRKAADDSTIYHWGEFDATGDPIDMTIRQYFDRFVYDVDFASAEEVGYDRSLGGGNTINNAVEVYPGRSIVEYHFSGFDPAFEGMDWRSLRIVLRPEKGKWFLEGLIHDEWTS